MGRYCALLVAPDGDYVTDYYADSKEEVRRMLANRGSQWFFYPFDFIVTTRMSRIVEAPLDMKEFERKTVKRALKAFKRAHDELAGDETVLIDDYIHLVKQNLLCRD